MAYTTINKGGTYFNTVLYTGTDSAQAVTGVGFQPDWTWIKCRSNGGSASFENVLTDAVRGVNKTLVSNDTEVETASNATGYLNIFDSDGFTTAAGGTSIDAVGGVGRTYASWNWLGANGTASNSNGSITSTVSANTTAGFSIVSYTGTGSAGATIGHGLGVAPNVIITKSRANAGRFWGMYHSSLGNTGSMALNSNQAFDTSTTYWNDTTPSSTVYTVGTNGDTNSSGTMIAYCFAEKQGYSKFGTYTGNALADGTFVYTGFKPAFVIVKRSSDTQSWVLWDNKRDGYNQTNPSLTPNENGAEETRSVDFLSNGFKNRQNNTATNAASTYMYMAFAEFPFTSSTGTPVTAR
jgi:hypothetical protein